MDKNTLSNYGWIVIAVLVLSVMIALATPFGEYIKAGVESTTAGLFDTSEKALNVVGMSAKGNPLQEKRVAVFGTSISVGKGSNGSGADTSYIKEIANNNNMSLQNYSVAGNETFKILNAYRLNKAQLESYNSNDYVIFEGILNDAHRNVPLGEITPQGTTSFNTDTTIGALEALIYEYQNSGCEAKVGFILTHIRASFNTTIIGTAEKAKFYSYWDAAITVFEKYDIPYLDLRDKEYSMADTLHPDTDGQLLMAKYVEPWLKTL